MTEDDEFEAAHEAAAVASVPAHPVSWEEAHARGLQGAAVIAAAVKTLPNAPGVYRMLGENGDVLYVGKARSLKKRVANYIRTTGNGRLAHMVASTVAMDFVRTRTETEALLLEANLIKRLRPRFNVLLRDDKSFPYILIAKDHEAPLIVKHRGARRRPGSYFGPFASAGAVGRTVNALQRAFLLRTCSDAVYESRTRPCLLFQIKRCSGPCTGEIGLNEYSGFVDQAEAFLSGSSRAVRAALTAEMQDASAQLDFERAARCRDRLAALSHIEAHQNINPSGVEEADIFAVHQAGGQTCVQVFFFRVSQNWGNCVYFPKADRSIEAPAVLESFLAQFYDGNPPPRLVLLSTAIEEQDLLAAALSERAGHKVTVTAPQRGEKRALVEQALTNAREALGRRLAETSTQDHLLRELAGVLGLSEPPRRIEVYDNSHVMGAQAVGAMVVAGPEGFSKSHYRKFNIRSEDIAPGDDYGMMREVFRRRFGRLLKEAGPRGNGDQNADALGPWPDLVLVDGGRGQLSAALGVLQELGVDGLPVVAVAKGRDREAGRETFTMQGREPFALPHRDPVLYFVQRLRDEAHRFAIGSHRARRKKDMVRSPLDEIAGIGPSRKRALLQHFGTAKAVGRAGVQELLAVPGISASTARAIYDHFHEASL